MTGGGHAADTASCAVQPSVASILVIGHAFLFLREWSSMLLFTRNFTPPVSDVEVRTAAIAIAIRRVGNLLVCVVCGFDRVV
jgi:hypothetical protein